MEDTFTLFLVAMVVTQSSICLLPLVYKVFTDRVSVESGLNTCRAMVGGSWVMSRMEEQVMSLDR